MMEILVIGSESDLQECITKFGTARHYNRIDSHDQARTGLMTATVVFDFRPEQIHTYRDFSGVVFLNVSTHSLKQLCNDSSKEAIFFGFVGLPTFLTREILEASLVRNTDREKLEEICDTLKTKFAIVSDQVALVTARVICMIINEAYFAIQENVASRSDIDLAMKLGTNYPFGPFEWCEKIGIKNVYESLNAIFESTGDERYEVCELLEEEYKRFAPSR
jgi:3-hydroxybutyryl-CoA dehydrogenase